MKVPAREEVYQKRIESVFSSSLVEAVSLPLRVPLSPNHAMLEAEIRSVLGLDKEKEQFSFYTMREMFDKLHSAELVDRSEVGEFAYWNKIRNNLVHSTSDISRMDAKSITEGILKLISSIKKRQHYRKNILSGDHQD